MVSIVQRPEESEALMDCGWGPLPTDWGGLVTSTEQQVWDVAPEGISASRGVKQPVFHSRQDRELCQTG